MIKIKALLLGVAVCWPCLGFGQGLDENTLFRQRPGTEYSQYLCQPEKDKPIDPGQLDSALDWTRKGIFEERRDDGTVIQSTNALCDANLNGAWLFRANLKSATLVNVNLSRANLEQADLSSAAFVDSNLSWAFLVGADLSGADLSSADLSGANLEKADLSDADLSFADLSGANLKDSILTNTRMSGANLSGVSYVPKTQPNVEDIAQANCLHLLKRDDDKYDPQGLVTLRNSLQVAGYREQERQVTYALKHSEFFTQRPAEKHSESATQRPADGQETHDVSKCVQFPTEKNSKKGWTEAGINYLLFELPTGWGMHPARALAVLFTLVPFFAVPYALALRSASSDGIWRIWSNERAREDLGSDKPELMVAGWPKAIWLGLYFSLISAFHLGWRDFNVGNWISRLQTREYSLRASGWVRTVAGIQSLISVYLLALWALTYFGRPFE